MNILFFNLTPFYQFSGGIASITFTLAELFISKGNRVEFLSLTRPEVDVNLLNHYFLPDSINPFCKINIDFFLSFIKKHNIQVIINQSAISNKADKLLEYVKKNTNIRIIHCIHNCILTQIKNYAYQYEYYLKSNKLDFIFTLLKNKFINSMLIKLYKFRERGHYCNIAAMGDKVVNLNEGLRNELFEIIGQRDIKYFPIIPNCTNIKSRSSIELEHKKNTVLWVGRVDFSVKRFDLMLKIWNLVYKKNPSWTLKVLGDGKDLSLAKEIVIKLGLKNIVFEGKTNPLKFYQEAKILCVTSSHESFSLVSVEAMMNGVVPVIFNSYFAAHTVLENGKNGLLVEPFNIHKYASALNSLMGDNYLLNKYSLSALNSSNKYLPESVYESWVSILESN